MEPINVVCCPDNYYAMPTGVMLCSLCENNKDVDLHIHVVYLELTGENIQLLKKTVEDYHQSITFYKMDPASLPQIQFFSEQQKLPITAFLRLFVSSILPPDVHRTLYLDGDIIIRKSIRELFNMNLIGYGVAVVPDQIYCYTDIARTYNSLKYSPSLGYFNSGVLLINLDYWREKGIEEKFLVTIKEYMNVLYHCDQDVLNKVFCDSKIFVPLTYNFQNIFLAKPEFRKISWEYNQEIAETALDPIVLHFTGSKPWKASCDHPYKEEFHRYKALTVWKNVPVKGKIAWAIRKRIKKLMMWLRIPYNYYHIEWAYSYSDLRHD